MLNHRKTSFRPQKNKAETSVQGPTLSEVSHGSPELVRQSEYRFILITLNINTFFSLPHTFMLVCLWCIKINTMTTLILHCFWMFQWESWHPQSRLLFTLCDATIQAHISHLLTQLSPNSATALKQINLLWQNSIQWAYNDFTPWKLGEMLHAVTIMVQ